MARRELTIEEFTKQMLGYAGGFRVQMERANARHPGIYEERRLFADFFSDFVRYVRDERRKPR